jgi:hypothetical protein
MEKCFKPLHRDFCVVGSVLHRRNEALADLFESGIRVAGRIGNLGFQKPTECDERVLVGV